MEGGYPLDKGHGESAQMSWVEGPPEKAWHGSMKTKGRSVYQMYAWRCPRCTLVRLYAPED